MQVLDHTNQLSKKKLLRKGEDISTIFSSTFFCHQKTFRKWIFACHFTHVTLLEYELFFSFPREEEKL